jgi:hypothetical protein
VEEPQPARRAKRVRKGVIRAEANRTPVSMQRALLLGSAGVKLRFGGCFCADGADC